MLAQDGCLTVWDLALQQPVTTRLQAPDGQQLAAWGVQLAGHPTEVGQSTVCALEQRGCEGGFVSEEGTPWDDFIKAGIYNG